MLNRILNLIKKILPKKLLKKILPVYHFLLAKLSALIYNYPSEKMLVIGVTGTAGKSSSCYFIAQILESAGYKVGLTTTTLFKIDTREWLNNKKMTMLGRLQTQKLLAQMVTEKCQVAIIETSSQGIEQFRHIGINYDILVFTNLYPEHIENHGGFENYKKAKGKLFKYLTNCSNKKLIIKNQELNIAKTIIINGDDEHAEYFLNFKIDRKIVYGVNNELRIMNYGKSVEKICAEKVIKENTIIKTIIHNSLFIIHLLGDYNLYNVLAGLSVAKILNIDEEKIKTAVANLKPLPGRLEFIKNNRGIKILVDYAFEPEALKKLYVVVKDVPHNHIIHVLGAAGGGRDSQKRPKMGLLAAENSDVIIITNEDPYDENPQKIIDEVAKGTEFPSTYQGEDSRHGVAEGEVKEKLFKILDRREAIKKALELAQENDLILITGKGAEQAICVANGEMIPWDDRQVVREELKKISQ